MPKSVWPSWKLESPCFWHILEQMVRNCGKRPLVVWWELIFNVPKVNKKSELSDMIWKMGFLRNMKFRHVSKKRLGTAEVKMDKYANWMTIFLAERGLLQRKTKPDSKYIHWFPWLKLTLSHCCCNLKMVFYIFWQLISFRTFQNSLFFEIRTLVSWLKSTLLLKSKCFDSHIYMKTQL